MFIKSLELTNFKRFKEFAFECTSDITVIKGPNEQGKSTIAEAISVALFDDPASSRKELKEFRRWGSEKGYMITLSFEAGGEDYTLKKDFEKKEIELTNTTTGETFDEFKSVAKKLSELGGYQTRELFFQTACVKQGELAVLDKKQTIAEALQNLVSGGGMAISLNGIFRRIEKGLEELTRGLGLGYAKNPGIILRLQKSIGEKSRDRDERRNELTKKEAKEEKLRALRVEQSELTAKFEIKERAYKRGIGYLEAKKILSDLHNEYDALRKKRAMLLALEKERAEFQKTEKALKGFASIDLASYIGASQKIEALDQEIGKTGKKIEGMVKEGVMARRVLSPKIAIPALFLAGITCLGFWIPTLFFAGGLLLILFIFILWLLFLSPGSFSSGIEKGKLYNLLSVLEKQKEEIVQKLKRDFENLGVSTLEEIEGKKNELHAVVNQIKSIEGRIEGRRDGEEDKEILEKMEELEKRIGIEESKIKEQNLAPFSSLEEEEEVLRAREALQKRSKDLEKKIISLEAVSAREGSLLDEVKKLEERIFSLEEDLERAKNREKTLKILHQSLKDAQRGAFNETKDALQTHIGEFLSEITGGKYERIAIGENMEVKVFSPEKGQVLTPEGNLSKGAIEQIYLVARFALISLLYPASERPLVILDDPFGNFDGSRKAKTRNIIKRLSENFQILLLTCSDGYEKWGKVIDLETAK